MNLTFTAVEGKYEATYTGGTGALQIICEPGTEIYVMGTAGATEYHTLEVMTGSKFLRWLDMTGLTSVKIVSDTKPITALIKEE